MKTQQLLAILIITTALNPLVAQTETFFIKASTLIDGRGGRVDDAVIRVDGDRIGAVGSSDSLEIPAGARVIDLGTATLLPGFIDMHVHLNGKATEHGYRALSRGTHRAAITGVVMARRTLLAGFTTVRSVGAPAFTDVALRNAINEGDVPGPRLKVSGPALGVTGGHCDLNLLPPEFEFTASGVADGPWEVRARVRENIKYGADLIKFCATGGVLSKGTKVGIQQYTFEEMKNLIDEAHMRGLRVAAHAHGTEGIKTAIRAGADTVEHASFLDEEAIRLALEHGTFLSMDIYNTEYILTEGEAAGILQESLDKERVVGSRQRESFSRAVEAGVKVVFGSDAGVYPHGQNGRQFSRMVRFGMSPMQAITAGTGLAAEALGWDEVGVLEAGRFADIVAVPGNPIEDISALERPSFIMKGGVVYSGKGN